MRIYAALAVLVIASCTPTPIVVPAPVQIFRDTSAQIASQTDVTAQRMTGTWHIRQSFAGPPRPATTIAIFQGPNAMLQMTLTSIVCNGDDCGERQSAVFLSPAGPGRWTPIGAGAGVLGAEIWVMWMDFDSRTATLGTPSGEFGWIMDENPTGGRDRIIAARDIMDWFGYDLTRLEEVNL
jgi:apolipoprotein D and lipocalin family protein